MMDKQTRASNDNDDDSDSVKGIVSPRGVSIAERRAAKCGFKVKRISAARDTSPIMGSPVAHSPPCLTIPPGISPTALLDSPILLPNSQPSPTTGTIPLAMSNHENSVLNALKSVDEDKSIDAKSLYRIKPQVSSPSDLAQRADVDYQALSADLPVECEFSAEFPKENAGKTCAIDPIDDVQFSSSMIVNDNCGSKQIHSSDRDSDLTSLQKEPVHGQDVGAHNLLEGDQKENNPQLELVQTSEDEYNWRKYGQKQVKGSEYPRSYYKCTHLNCHVKKKVERSFNGQITRIIYKGVHNHQKPQPSRQPLLGSAFSCDEMSVKSEGGETSVKVEGELVCRNTPAGLKYVKLGFDSQADGLEITSSTSVLTELLYPSSTTRGKSVGTFESSETPEFSSTLASHDDNDDGNTQGSILLGDDVEEDEYLSKRRKLESSLLEANLATRAVREPRVVVQIESEVDILDDGYRWRKYGQKVIKGNPNPRSYYKCTSAGCLVRKHVERASHNLKFVITTYEGKHNHEVPAARNSSHVNSSGLSLLPGAADAPSAMTLPQNTYTSKPEPQIQDIAPCFERKPELNSGYLRPSFLENLNNEMKFGIPSLYLMKFPPIQNPRGSFGLNANPHVTQSGSTD